LQLIIIEAILQLTWNNWYFRTGIPLLNIEKAASPLGPEPPDIEAIADKIRSTISSRLVFKTIGDNDQAFRERVFGGRSSPIMRGLITYNYYEGKVKLKGYVYWHMLFFVVDWYAFIISYKFISSSFPRMWLFLLFPIAVTGLLYLFQARKFKKVLGVAAQMWSQRP
jgi:hypothetical protein